MPVRTTGSISYADWKEEEIRAVEDGPKLSHATVANTFTGGIEAARTDCDYNIVYTGATTGVFTGLELLTGRLDGREGTFVLEEHGAFHEDGTVTCTFTVVPGTGTGALTGLRGSGEYTCRAGEQAFPYTFEYEPA
ncbi:DUF3224 domain-containing protein [Streptomyces sp. TLI_171]|uniref:DUF3224 domain-containing protein n=1 Tax=Streptomyces sp. TLI_171 TaxID=1938859 RepID=UPI000C19FF4C|nr:DUF3224 domain-containing protein [Streptomyces sp. TLI_171]RKE17831.1 uncharacterized protein DUF3224 [Streptomyces sp. TLI_171]